MPERHLAGLTGRRRHHHPFERDVFDAPGGGTQQEGLARAALVHHLLVELAHAGAVGQEHPEQAAIGDGAAAGDGEAPRPVAGAQRVVHPVPHQPRPQFAELVARVPAGQQVEGVQQQVVAELGEVGAAPHETTHIGDGALGGDGNMGDDLLGQHIERIAQIAGGLDGPVDHPPHHHCCLEQVATVLGVDGALAGFAHRVAGTADALQPAADGARRLDLHDEVDGPHVDAQFEAAGGHDAAQHPPLQLVLDDDALLAGERAVVRLHQFDGGGLGVGAGDLVEVQLVQLGRQPLGLTARVGEHDGAAVLQDLGEDARVDAGPDAGALRGEGHRGGPAAQLGDRLAQFAHVFHGDDHIDLERFADTGVDDDHRARGAVVGAAPEEAGDLLERALGGRQADALRRSLGDLLEPFERQHEVRATFGGRQGVDLVDDDGLDVHQRIARRRGEHQIQALGRGDEQVGRSADECLTVFRRGVARAHGDGGLGIGLTQPLGGQADAEQRGAQVLLDVERQRTQRRDVEHPRALLRIGRGRGAQPVDAGQERGEGLARAGGCADERVLACSDVRPALHLGRGGFGERRGEPRPHRRREPLEHRMIGHEQRLRGGCARDTGSSLSC